MLNKGQKVSKPQPCEVCMKLAQRSQQLNLITSALYHKYSQSQNYFFLMKINQMLEQQQNKIISMMDQLVLDENMERLNRFYYKKEHKKKITKLTEYYKFHCEIPRLFMIPIIKVVNSHHNKKRRLKYYEVKRLMNQPVEEPQSICQDPKIKTTFVLKDITLPQFQNSITVYDLLKNLSLQNVSNSSFRPESSQSQLRMDFELNLNDHFGSEQKKRIEQAFKGNEKLIIPSINVNVAFINKVFFNQVQINIDNSSQNQHEQQDSSQSTRRSQNIKIKTQYPQKNQQSIRESLNFYKESPFLQKQEPSPQRTNKFKQNTNNKQQKQNPNKNSNNNDINFQMFNIKDLISDKQVIMDDKKADLVNIATKNIIEMSARKIELNSQKIEAIKNKYQQNINYNDNYQGSDSSRSTIKQGKSSNKIKQNNVIQNTYKPINPYSQQQTLKDQSTPRNSNSNSRSKERNTSAKSNKFKIKISGQIKTYRQKDYI